MKPFAERFLSVRLSVAVNGDEEKQNDAQSKFSLKSLLLKSVKKFKYVILTDS